MTQHVHPQEPDRPRDEGGVVAPARAMLVAIVLVAIAAATYLAGLGTSSDDTARSAATTASRQATGSSGSSADATPSASPSSTASPSSPSASANAKASSTPSAKSTQKSAQKSAQKSDQPSTGAAPAASADAVERRDVRVSVFNNSGVTGLAARTSGKVKAAGWDVVGTDNWYGSIPRATVYYPERLQKAADLLAEDIGVARVRPAVTPMRNDRLTVIVTADYDA